MGPGRAGMAPTSGPGWVRNAVKPPRDSNRPLGLSDQSKPARIKPLSCEVVEEAEKAGCGRSDIDAAKQALQHLVALEEQEALMNQIQVRYAL